jgi:hypothetical protein
MTSATVHIAATEMPIATALRQKDSGDIASPPFDQTTELAPDRFKAFWR